MTRRKEQTPFEKVMTTRMELRLYAQYGDTALKDRTPQEFAAQVLESFEYLLTFRNIINGMVSFDETPERAVLPYLPVEMLAEAAKAVDC